MNAAVGQTLRESSEPEACSPRCHGHRRVSVAPVSTPTPRQIFRMFDRGEITRGQFRAMLDIHARALIEEMEEVHENWLAAWMETLRNRRVAARLARDHSEVLVREVFVALSEVPDFPVAHWLWNADRPHLPLYCFLRTRREPVFRVLRLASEPFFVTVSVEFGSARKDEASREKFTFQRDRLGRLDLASREPL